MEVRANPHPEDLTLFGSSGSQKYLNVAKRLEAAHRTPPHIAAILPRISEVLALTPALLLRLDLPISDIGYQIVASVKWI